VDNATFTDWDLSEKAKDIPVKMGDAAPINETFPDISIADLALQTPSVLFRKCGDPSAVSGSPLSRECDDIQGKPLGDCVGASSNDCTNSFKVWSQLLLASF